MSTPMKIPRTINQQYEIVRAADAEQRKRKTSVKGEATVSPTACRRIIMGALRAPIPPSKGEVANPHILPITLPCGDTAFPHTPSATPYVTTPHAHPFESQPNDPW